MTKINRSTFAKPDDLEHLYVRESINRKGREEEDAKGAEKKLLCAPCVFFFASFAVNVFPYLQMKFALSLNQG